mgnify:CR=1 FL=1|jgi:diguanylate cyclase (GGDEF)-like protein
MTSIVSPRLASGAQAAAAPVAHDESSLQRQLAQYAEDFQELVGRHHDLARRHEKLKASHAQLAQAREVLGTLNPTFHELCLVINRHGEILHATDAARALFLLDKGTVWQLQQVVAPFHLGHLEIMLSGLADGSHSPAFEQAQYFLYPGGDPARARLFAVSCLSLPDGDNTCMCWILRDLSSDAQTDMDTDHMFKLVMRRHQGALVTDPDGQIIAVDGVFAGHAGRASEELLGVMPAMFRVGHEDLMGHSAFWDDLKSHGHWQGEVVTVAPNGQSLGQWMSVTAIRDTAAETVAYIALLSDQDMMLSAERSMLDAVYHDTLTGLPNQALFRDLVERKLYAASRTGTGVALLSIALDRLQWIHDTEDQGMSEAVLLAVSERLQEAIRGCDILARTGHDRFAILLAGLEHEPDLTLMASRVIKALSTPILLRKQKLVMGGSVGCARFPQDGSDASQLVEHADMALLLARKEGGNRVHLYSEKAYVQGIEPLQTPQAGLRGTL